MSSRSRACGARRSTRPAQPGRALQRATGVDGHAGALCRGAAADAGRLQPPVAMNVDGTRMTGASPCTVGPVLYHWSRQALMEFYAGVAESAADTVVLGETVCARRRETQARRLAGAGARSRGRGQGGRAGDADADRVGGRPAPAAPHRRAARVHGRGGRRVGAAVPGRRRAVRARARTSTSTTVPRWPNTPRWARCAGSRRSICRSKRSA